MSKTVSTQGFYDNFRNKLAKNLESCLSAYQQLNEAKRKAIEQQVEVRVEEAVQVYEDNMKAAGFPEVYLNEEEFDYHDRMGKHKAFGYYEEYENSSHQSFYDQAKNKLEAAIQLKSLEYRRMNSLNRREAEDQIEEAIEEAQRCYIESMDYSAIGKSLKEEDYVVAMHQRSMEAAISLYKDVTSEISPQLCKKGMKTLIQSLETKLPSYREQNHSQRIIFEKKADRTLQQAQDMYDDKMVTATGSRYRKEDKRLQELHKEAMDTTKTWFDSVFPDGDNYSKDTVRVKLQRSMRHRFEHYKLANASRPEDPCVIQ